VPAFIAAAYVMNYPSEHNIYPSEDEPYFHLDTVVVDSRMSIEKLALAIGTTVDEIKQYNPSLKKGVIPFNTEGTVLTLPYHQAIRVSALRHDSSFNNKIDENLLAINRSIQAQKSPEKVIYRVKSGDYLAKIAKKYDVSVAELKKWNRGTIRGNKVSKGQKLKIYTNQA
jgi:membrane-bound lytic murein transglycosylase D